MRFFIILIFFLSCLICIVYSRSLILANGYNVLLFYPREYGGNDDIRVIFDIRNVTSNTFKYLPFIVDVIYDSTQNIAYCYLESAVKSYIMLLKWFGGKWCFQIMFEFESSLYMTHMYHSLVVVDNFIYWTTERYIMSGRAPGVEMRRLMQPGWERIFKMSADRENKILFVASYDFGENNLYSCSILKYSCVKLISTTFPINSIFYDTYQSELYVGSLQLKYLLRYIQSNSSLVDVKSIQTSISEMYLSNGTFGVFTKRDSIDIYNEKSGLRRARPKLVDPYALQYVFTFDRLDQYPSPFGPIQDILWRDQQYLLYFYILAIDYVENDNVFLPQMDLNNNFLQVDSCTNIFYDSKQAILIPSLIGAAAVCVLVMVAIVVCVIHFRFCKRRDRKVEQQVKDESVPVVSSSTPKSSFTSLITGKKPTFSSGIYIMGNNKLEAPSLETNLYDSISEKKKYYRNEVNEYLDGAQQTNKNFVSMYHVPFNAKQNYINIKKAYNDDGISFKNN